MSEKEKDGFVIYSSYLEKFEELSNEQFGQLIRLLCLYNRTKEKPKIADKMVRVAFGVAKVEQDANLQKYEKIREKRTKAIEARWAKESESKENENDTNEYKCIQMNTNDTDKDKDKDKDKVKVKVKDSFSSEKEIIKALDSNNIMMPRETKTEIMQAWNTLELDQIREISKKREKALQELIVKYGIDGIHEAIEKVRNAPFLMGEIKKDFRANFDWFLKGDNFLKTLEGAYDEGKGKKRKEDLINDTSGYGEISGMYDGFADSIGRKAE